jgi:solute carrier family 25 phosphate transporter 23/24/25/41
MSFIKPFFGVLFLLGNRRPLPELPPIEASLSAKRSAPFDVKAVKTASIAASAATSSRPAFILVPEVTAAEPDVLPAPDWTTWSNLRAVLISCVPSTGYFAAGAVAGIVSRTATAPLDRLKVYLIAQTGIRNHPLAKRHGLLGMMAVGLKNTGFAVKDLWQAGGLRSLYAGRCITDF